MLLLLAVIYTAWLGSLIAWRTFSPEVSAYYDPPVVERLDFIRLVAGAMGVLLALSSISLLIPGCNWHIAVATIIVVAFDMTLFSLVSALHTVDPMALFFIVGFFVPYILAICLPCVFLAGWLLKQVWDHQSGRFGRKKTGAALSLLAGSPAVITVIAFVVS